jgi:RNA polymerase sigma-70 factor (ECF subfamily)
MRGDDEAFAAFVAARSTALLRTAYLLTGDRGQAEDLVQTALAKTYLSWQRIESIEAVEAYVRRTMVNTHISWWRRVRGREVPMASPPDRDVADASGEAAARDEMWRLLATLPVKQRTALVLRHWGGLSEAEIASEMGCSPGTVKTHVARGLASLRERLNQDAASEGGVR